MGYETKEAINRMANMVEETIAMSDDANVYILQAAQTRLTELRVLLNVAGPGPTANMFHPTLEPLRNAVTQVLCGLQDETNAEIDESLADAELEAVLIIKEDTTQRLEQAHVNALCMLAHLNAAVLLLNKQRMVQK